MPTVLRYTTTQHSIINQQAQYDMCADMPPHHLSPSRPVLWGLRPQAVPLHVPPTEAMAKQYSAPQGAGCHPIDAQEGPITFKIKSPLPIAISSISPYPPLLPSPLCTGSSCICVYSPPSFFKAPRSHLATAVEASMKHLRPQFLCAATHPPCPLCARQNH